jgi:hypothetical protein
MGFAEDGMRRRALLAAIALVAIPGAASAEHWSRAYVVDWLEPAFLHDGPENDNIVPGKDCPAGAAVTPGWKVQFQTAWRDPETIKYYLDAENRPDGIRVMRWRGPNLEDVWAHPTAGPDLHMLPPVTWNRGLGFDLDGKVKTTDFTSPDGDAGIDNNYYRAAGCWVSYRGAPYKSQRGIGINGYMRDGLYTIVMVLSGDKDPMNDDNATLAIYQSKDKIVKDNQGQVAHDASYSILPTSRTQSLVKVSVAHGLIETASAQEIRIRDEAWNASIPDQLQLMDGKLRFRIKEDGGLEGLLGGYVSWKALYKKQAIPARDTESNQGLDMPTFYYQLERYADGDPDPATGKNRRISAAYRLRAVPAFVLTPDYAKPVTIAQYFDPADQPRLAQNNPAAAQRAEAGQ